MSEVPLWYLLSLYVASSITNPGLPYADWTKDTDGSEMLKSRVHEKLGICLLLRTFRTKASWLWMELVGGVTPSPFLLLLAPKHGPNPHCGTGRRQKTRSLATRQH